MASLVKRFNEESRSNGRSNKYAKFSKKDENSLKPNCRSVFNLILFALVFPVVSFNIVWFFRAEFTVLNATTLNIVRVLLSISFLAYAIGINPRAIRSPKFTGGLIFALLVVTASQLNRMFSRFPDTNADSVTSHLLVTEAISNGWSPLSIQSGISNSVANQSLLTQTDLGIGRIETGIGFQTIQAFYNILFGIESSYVLVNILFLALAVLKLLEVNELAISPKRPGNSFARKLSWTGRVMLFLMSPIIVQQVNSAYTDLSGYCLLITLILISNQIILDDKVNRNNLLSIITLIILTPAIKLQLIALVIPVILMLLFKYTKNSRRAFQSFQNTTNRIELIRKSVNFRNLIVTFFLLSLLYFPLGMFASEVLEGRLPLHANRDYVASTWGGSIPEFMELNGVERVWTVISGRTSLNPDAISTDGLFRIPTVSELRDAGYLDSRVAGFGPLFGDLLLVSYLVALSGFIVIYAQNSRKKRSNLETEQQIRQIFYAVYLLVSYLVISIIIPLSFMARYNPQYLVMALLSLHVISIAIYVGKPQTFPKFLLKATTRVLVLLYILNFQITFNSHLKIKDDSIRMIENMKEEKLTLQNQGEYKQVRFYFGNKTGLILATTGEISQESFQSNATLTCAESNRIIQISDEIGICAIP